MGTAVATEYRPTPESVLHRVRRAAAAFRDAVVRPSDWTVDEAPVIATVLALRIEAGDVRLARLATDVTAKFVGEVSALDCCGRYERSFLRALLAFCEAHGWYRTAFGWEQRGEVAQ